MPKYGKQCKLLFLKIYKMAVIIQVDLQTEPVLVEQHEI